MGDNLRDDDYQALAGFRHELRRFLRFSEDAALSAGVTPQQHQVLLAIRAAGGQMLVGALADHLMLRPHSVSGQIDRLAKQGLVQRTIDRSDRRKVSIELTPAGAAILSSLSTAHRAELRRIRPLLSELIDRL